MKKNTKKSKSRVQRKTVLIKKTNRVSLAKRRRPTHKRLALHPLSIMFMLCLGVLLVLSTFSAAADSYTVSAVVPLPPGPSDPAVMTSPTDGQHFSSQVVQVSGTCPTDPYTRVYVALITNDVWAGYSGCSASNTFQVTATLYPGENSLQVRVFDYYNTPGPLLSSIDVYYDAPALPQTNISPPVVAPQTIQILQVDNNVPFVSVSATPIVSTDPTLTGLAPPFSHVQITIHSAVIYCDTTADAQGFWSCKVDQKLPLGEHHIYIQATTPLGKVINFQTFQIVAGTSTPVSTTTNTTFTLTTNFKPVQYSINQPVSFNLNVNGGVAPYAFNISWGDGTNTTVTRLSSGSFSISHTYSKTNSLLENESIKIEGIDSQGSPSSLQLFAPVKNPAYKNFVSYITQSSGLWSVFSGIKSWLWVIWPAYIIIMLMIISFWLGERQELMNLIRKHSRKRKVALRR